MRGARLWRGWLVGLLGAGLLLTAAPAAQAAVSDPLFVFAPFGEGACGMGVDPTGRFYVSDYYDDQIRVQDQNANYNAKTVTGATGFLGQVTAIDAIDGPCALSFDASGDLYVNDYHRAVMRYGPFGAFGSATTITGAMTPEGTHPTGVAVDPASGDVYVDQRDHVSVFDESGEPVVDETEPLNPKPLTIGNGPLKDGYGIAFSSYPGTQGYLYIPDAATNTIEVYDSATPQAGPVETIDGSETPKGEFVSLRDASIAVDRVTGEIYVIDDLQPKYTERPQAIVYVFGPDGTYEGHLKFLVTWGMPSGLAVDNSETPTQGRVYVTSGNSSPGAIYAYGPGAATTAPIALPSAAPPPSGGGSESAQVEEAATAGAGAATLTQPKESLSAPAAVEAAPSPATPKRPRPKAHRKPKPHHRKAHRTHHRRVKAGR
jgi:DNA-binding beta-propeller fold protein YncE